MLPCYYQYGFNQKLPLKLAAKNDMPLQTPNGGNDYCKFSVQLQSEFSLLYNF